ncbi:MAG: NAD(P) transhydrogenase subunit alpha [Candidatus Calescibacterium sp.]|nr:NAD(P) transhydrogenase subunit alpha [Candidatus Calescibacterium sp.]MCX7972209.1 NAD(P) transhydrogenase subunit alpha [bacterium]MDW8194900.1 NAD(P) transhydrogenase subunit alpha [Candidatus Calescibacterium sp.]
MIIGVLREEQDNRVSLIPNDVKNLSQKGFSIWIEKEAGIKAGFNDEDYIQAGAQIKDRQEVINADIILAINRFNEMYNLKQGAFIIGLYNPYDLEFTKNFIDRTQGTVNCISLELVPRISRAQSIDVLSSMATMAGYKAVILAAHYSSKIFPLLMTAAGTITPAKVLVIGAGVAGLQAIATSKRLGANVWGFDPRPATKDQIKSVGGNYIEFQIQDFEDKSGYAKQADHNIIQKEIEVLFPYVVQSDIVITTASVPGKKAPILITREMVEKMRIGSVIVDMVAASGGNCELTQKDKIVNFDNKIIIGYSNLPSMVPHDSSKMYSRNIYNLISHLSRNTNRITPDFQDEIDRNIFLVYSREIINEKIKGMMQEWK